MVADLFEEHRVIVAEADAFLALVQRVPHVSIEEINRHRARLGSLTMTHVHTEEDVIIQPLLASDRLGELTGAVALLAEMREGRRAYSDQIRKWTPQAIEANRNAYADAVEEIVEALKARIVREEALLYRPALKLLDSALPLPPRTDAIRQAPERRS